MKLSHNFYKNSQIPFFEALPIKCMEAVVLSIYLTNGVPCLGRFPINFKSELPARAGVSQKYFYHVVLGLAHGNRFGAIGLRFTIDILYFTSKLPTTYFSKSIH